MDEVIWEQREDETQISYEWFCHYRDMGVHRSLEKIRQRYGKNASYLRQLQLWSSKYNWVDRAEAWDKHQQALLDDERAAKRQALVDRELADYHRLIGKWDELFNIAQPLKTTRTIQNDDGSTTKVLAVNTSEWRALTKLRREISSMGRLAMGMPETIANTQFTGEDGGPAEIVFVWKQMNDGGGHGDE